MLMKRTDLALPSLSVCECVFRTLAEMAAATSLHVVAIIEPIIQHADWFFPDGKTSVLSLSNY